MSSNPLGLALLVIRIVWGLMFLVEGITRLGWLAGPQALIAVLNRWLVDADPVTRWYLETVALPGAPLFARMVVVGELLVGLGLILGFRTRLMAVISLVMVLNFHLGFGVLFRTAAFTTTGIPALAVLIGLAIAGRRIPWSLR